MKLRIDEIARLYEIYGGVPLQGERVTERQHALQCAQLAQRSGASSHLIAAALLHDLGRLLTIANEAAFVCASDDDHQYAALPFLRGSFPPSVTEPIRMHEEAKRYLCMMDSGYWATLPESSRLALKSKGGPLLASEGARFIQREHAYDAIAICKWNDVARNPDVATPSLSHFLPILRDATIVEEALAA